MQENPSQFTIPRSQIDFKALLNEYRSQAQIRFVHISDTHISHDPTYAIPEAAYHPTVGAQALVDQINKLPFKPDFVLHTGDIAFDPEPQSYQVAKKVFSKLQYPIYYLTGNHDNAQMLQSIVAEAKDIKPKFDYEFELKGIQFVCLDSNGPAPFAGGSLTAEQLTWLENICKADDSRALVVAIHHNVLPIGAPFWDSFMRMTNGEAFHQTLLHAKHRIRGVFSGHVHQATETYRDGILYSTVLSSWYQLECYPGQEGISADYGAEPGFNVVTVTPTQTFIRRHRFKVNTAEYTLNPHLLST